MNAHDMDLDSPDHQGNEPSSTQTRSYATAVTPPQSTDNTPHRQVAPTTVDDDVGSAFSGSAEGSVAPPTFAAGGRMSDSAAPESPIANSDDGDSNSGADYAAYEESSFMGDSGYRQVRGRPRVNMQGGVSEVGRIEHKGFFNDFGNSWHIAE
ncbi:hypothetical protein GQ54DRAFT_302186 [Martensiomyces pterosporus]|nr:hypothetical protein GQ54DRAFT_302186 [Martensiomyces pterosporus]